LAPLRTLSGLASSQLITAATTSAGAPPTTPNSPMSAAMRSVAIRLGCTFQARMPWCPCSTARKPAIRCIAAFDIP